MKKIDLIFLILISLNAYCQSKGEKINLEKYIDCKIEMPIKHSMSSKKSDIEKAKYLDKKEIIVISIKKNNKIKRYHRGYIIVNKNGVFFEPLSSVIDIKKTLSQYLIFSSKNTYVFDAECFDLKDNNQKYQNEEVYCDSEDTIAIEYFNTGNLALKLNAPEKAIPWFENAILRDSTFCDAWNNLGISHIMNGDFEKSYYSYINSVMIDSTNFVSWKNINDLFEQTQDTINSVRTLIKMKKLRPDDNYTNSRLIEYQYILDTIK